jgi:hypothetical protein
VKIDAPSRRLYLTFGVVSLATLVLGGLLALPAGGVKPDRRPFPLDMDDATGLEFPASAKPPAKAP